MPELNQDESERMPLLYHTVSSEANIAIDQRTSTDSALQATSILRRAFIAAAIGTLVFLQGSVTRLRKYTNPIASNISLITTTQSMIANDLNAFDEASWFTSAYLV
jgi:hypothetical protein